MDSRVHANKVVKLGIKVEAVHTIHLSIQVDIVLVYQKLTQKEH